MGIWTLYTGAGVSPTVSQPVPTSETWQGPEEHQPHEEQQGLSGFPNKVHYITEPSEPARAAAFDMKLYFSKSKTRECFLLFCSAEFPQTGYTNAENSFLWTQPLPLEAQPVLNFTL